MPEASTTTENNNSAENGRRIVPKKLVDRTLDAFSIIILLACTWIVVGGIIDGKSEFTLSFGQVHPAFLLLLLICIIALIAILEGLQIAIVKLKVSSTHALRNHPRALRIHKLCSNTDSVRSFLVGRQFALIVIVFLTAKLSTFRAMTHLPFTSLYIPQWIGLIFIDTGIVGAFLVLIFGQLAPQLHAERQPVEFMNQPMQYFVVLLCLLIDTAGVARVSSILSIVLDRLSRVWNPTGSRLRHSDWLPQARRKRVMSDTSVQTPTSLIADSVDASRDGDGSISGSRYYFRRLASDSSSIADIELAVIPDDYDYNHDHINRTPSEFDSIDNGNGVGVGDEDEDEGEGEGRNKSRSRSGTRTPRLDLAIGLEVGSNPRVIEPSASPLKPPLPPVPNTPTSPALRRLHSNDNYNYNDNSDGHSGLGDDFQIKVNGDSFKLVTVDSIMPATLIPTGISHRHITGLLSDFLMFHRHTVTQYNDHAEYHPPKVAFKSTAEIARMLQEHDSEAPLPHWLLPPTHSYHIPPHVVLTALMVKNENFRV